MIINFSVENFGSIKEKQTLSFLANKSDHLEDYYIIEPIKGLRLNKLALIYGANASGKTTVLKALDFLRSICTNPLDKKTEKFDFEPFLFDEHTPKQNTKFELEFVQKNIRYLYEVELNKRYVVNERLYDFNPNKALVFERTSNELKELTSIKFGNKIIKRKSLEENLEIFTLWNNTVLGGFQKTNIDNTALINTNLFFRNLVEFIDVDERMVDIISKFVKEESSLKNFFNRLIKKADFKIDRVKVGNIENLDSIKRENLEFIHTVSNKKYSLKFADESLGTRKYLSSTGFLVLLLFAESIILIDELESSLHPDLFNHFLLTYLVNGKKESQLIATTHNREILNNRDLFRDDAIWFTNKNEHSATELYSLADFDSSVVRDTSNVLNAYKSGKLGGVPNLGDYYIDLEDGE
ncbi:AAA family ATPase [Chryseobacterium balustinum]|uniref:ATPase/GTPase, AAA15 family n=1 Tax=Chryseobacterium balustinum TaxID=246 RepID=A0AAX2INC3_9FLAO|nr:ATP-binding protein [Chryseobacterium balustinum]AZB27902.1 ATP-binding protein [Chryseobacterium balustinum]SKB53653.1 ATPase/GTPase, AAA15 family [Chryseobacterium balustinum]SQA89890.1 Predicted ATPase [Chryseobacterium balustinum]